VFGDLRQNHVAALGATILLLLVLSVPAAQAASVTSDGTVATFTGDAGERDRLDMKTIDPSTVEFGVDNTDTITEGANCTEVNADTTRCTVTERVVVDARDGNDYVNADHVGDHVIVADGGAGHDVLIGGLAADDLRGGPGNDTVTGLMEGLPAGADRVEGGPDDDTIYGVGDADDAFGGSGSDRLVYVAGNTGVFPIEPANVSFTLDDIPNDGRNVDAANVHSDVEHVVSYFTSGMELGYDGGWGVDPAVSDEGGATIRGTDGPNTIQGGTDNDNLDALAGNDVLSAGHGDDRVNSVDGFADRLACGPGGDAVTADTLDDVSETCETVERTEVGVAGGPPPVAEDAPPAVTLDPGPALSATATDDRGVSAVQFLDDDRLVCTDDTAPYTCDYRPRGEDVGRNTLTAIAIDTAQQTASDRRAITVARFAPASVTLRATRRGVSGRVALPAEVSPALGCKGTVAVKVGRAVKRRARVKPDCTYSARVKLRRRARVRAAFGGNDVLTAKMRTARVR
jgi:Ca2+-binding RTX toxin-like protein